MQTWIKRSLLIVAGSALAVSALMAVAANVAPGHTEAHRAEMRSHMVEKIAKQLKLNATQRPKLEALANAWTQQRKAVMEDGGDMHSNMQALVAGDKFDRSQAQAMVDQKAKALQTAGPALVTAAADFYDSLNAEQQKQVRDFMAKHKEGWHHRRG